VLVDKLEKDELVVRKARSQDRRAIRVFITDKGRDYCGKSEQDWDRFNSRLYDLWGRQSKEFTHGIKNIINGLDG
jgi:DNA-binding MarR family transcriptional regulator